MSQALGLKDRVLYADFLSDSDRSYFYNLPLFERRRQGDCPKFLYKFYGWDFDNSHDDQKKRERFSNLILHNEVWLSSRLDFNDPYDAYPAFDKDVVRLRNCIDNDLRSRGFSFSERRKILEKLIVEFFRSDARGWNGYHRALHELDSHTGIFCLTENVREMLMWAHYANSHKGFCLVIDPYEDLDFLVHLNPVKYSDQRQMVSCAFRDPEDVDKVYFHKALCWAYEKEWRFVSREKCHRKIRVRDGFFKAFILAKDAPDAVHEFLREMNANRILSGMRSLPIFYSDIHPDKYKFCFSSRR